MTQRRSSDAAPRPRKVARWDCLPASVQTQGASSLPRLLAPPSLCVRNRFPLFATHRPHHFGSAWFNRCCSWFRSVTFDPLLPSLITAVTRYLVQYATFGTSWRAILIGIPSVGGSPLERQRRRGLHNPFHISKMPATRSSRKQSGAPSLLGHFHATKRSTGGPQTTAKGKSVPQEKAKQVTAAPIPATPTASVPASSSTSDTITSLQDAPRYATPEAPARPSTTSAVDAYESPRPSSSSSSLSPSPPPPLLGSTKKPLTVRHDPDRRKLYLMISPGKLSPGSSSSSPQKASTRSAPSQLSRPMPYARQGSPTADRTPIRHVDELFPKQPPAAPRKRRLSQVDFDRLRRDNEESPLPHDKRRPSFKAFGASQEGGLSLMEAQAEQTALTRAQTSARSQSPSESASSSDDDLILTPRKVRERGSGITPPSFATPTKAAKFEDPFSTPRPKPTISAGIFSSLAKPPPLSASSRTSAKQPHPSSSTNISSDDDNPFLDATSPNSEAAAVGHPIPTLPYALSPGLALPQHYNTISLLHAALEHALVVHLATSGTAGSSTSSLDSTLTDTFGQSIVRLPNLITYSALRPLVERTSGRRLGPVELARLMYIWSRGQVANAPAVNPSTAPTKAILESAQDRRATDTLSGLGFLLGRQRSLDANGRRTWDWSLGIELTVKRARRQATPPMQVSFGSQDNRTGVEMPSTPTKRGSASGVFGLDTPPTTPPSTASKRKRENSGEGGSASPSASVGREGMSFVALWNNGMEERKKEVGKRLRSLVAGEMEDWLGDANESNTSSQEATLAADNDMEIDAEDVVQDAENIPRPSTPERRPHHRPVQIGAGGLPTPSSTRPEGKRRRMVDFNTSIMEVDTDGRQSERFLGRREEASAGAAWSRPSANQVLMDWPPGFELKTVKPIPCAVLPSLKNAQVGSGDHFRSSTVTAEADATMEEDMAAVASQASSATSSNRALSLMERIKAKEAAASNANLARRSLASHSSSSSQSQSGMMTNVKRRATLSRLPELASALYMLYTNSASSSSTTSTKTSSTSDASRLPILPLSQVISTLSKSSRVSLSPHEARNALDLLNELVPGMVELRPIGGTDWASLNMNIGQSGGLAEVRRRVREELSG